MIRKYQKRYPGEPIRVVAHSHGGNIALLASQANDVAFALVTLGTPIQPAYGAGAGLLTWHNVYSPADNVQVLPQNLGRTSQDAINIRLEGFSHTGLHTIKAWKEAFE